LMPVREACRPTHWVDLWGGGSPTQGEMDNKFKQHRRAKLGVAPSCNLWIPFGFVL